LACGGLVGGIKARRCAAEIAPKAPLRVGEGQNFGEHDAASCPQNSGWGLRGSAEKDV